MTQAHRPTRHSFLVALGLLSAGAGPGGGPVCPSVARADEPPADGVTEAQADGKMGRPVLTREALASAAVWPDGRFSAPLADGRRAELTLEPKLQRYVEQTLRSHRTAYAAAVVLDVEDGRVLALAGRTREEPDLPAVDLALTAWAPSASVFKLVTAAALLSRGVMPSDTLCYHDGVHSVEAGNLSANADLDARCNTFAWGLAHSQNAMFARFAVERLGTSVLGAMARDFGFGVAVDSDLRTSASAANIPTDPLSFARVAAGFWQTTLSPLHGAWLAATIARGGVTPPLHIIADVVDGEGRASIPTPTREQRVLSEDSAKVLGRMMVGVTEFGTARRSFHDETGRPLLGGIDVAGKTGTLTRRDGGPRVLCSWFVGFAPAHKPKVAVAVLLGNGPEGYVRAHSVAREVLAGYFHQPQDHAVVAAR